MSLSDSDLAKALELARDITIAAMGRDPNYDAKSVANFYETIYYSIEKLIKRNDSST